jgi:ribosomal-protein-alanine N-acetyltransferase
MLNPSFQPFPVLSSGRIVLRQFTSADAQALYELRADKEVMKFIDRPMATSIDDAYAFLKRMDDSLIAGDGISWAISLKDDPAMIGNIGLWRIIKENYRAEIGYMLNTEYQRKGIMQECFDLVLDYGFNSMGLHSIEANINPGNNASMKILEKNGFVKEAYFRENFFFNGRFLDSAIYSLLKSSWKARFLYP